MSDQQYAQLTELCVGEFADPAGIAESEPAGTLVYLLPVVFAAWRDRVDAFLGQQHKERADRSSNGFWLMRAIHRLARRVRKSRS